MSSGMKRPHEKTTSESIVSCILKRGSKTKGYGFHLLSQGEGAYVGTVVSPSIAESAGLKEGDEITEVNGKDIQNFNYSKITGIVGSNPYQVKIVVKRKQTDTKKDEEVAAKKRKICKFGSECKFGSKCEFDHPEKPAETKPKTIQKIEAKPLATQKTVAKPITQKIEAKPKVTQKFEAKPSIAKNNLDAKKVVQTNSVTNHKVITAKEKDLKESKANDSFKKQTPVTKPAENKSVNKESQV